MNPLPPLFLQKHCTKNILSNLNRVINFLHRERILKPGIGMKTKRAGLSTGSGKNIHSIEEEEELVNAHQQNFTSISIKPKTGNWAAGRNCFHSRKIINVDNGITQPSQADVIYNNPEEIKALSSEDAIDMAIKHLRESDLKLSSVIELHDTPKFQKCQSAFQSLARSIVYQQLATKAAASIYSRLVSLCGV
jgi:hypothetical protein